MKKLIKLLSLILSVVMSVSLFAGCNGGKENGDNDANVINKITTSSRVDLYNFEQWTPDFSCIKLQPMFGVVRRNKDKQYCKSGDYSAKLQPIGGHIKAVAPVVWFPTSSAAFAFDYQDFSYVDYVSFWMYNDQDEEKTVTVGLVNKYPKAEQITKLQGQTFNLKPNDWTLVKYVIDFGSMTLGSDIDRSDMITIKGIYLEYEIAMSSEIEDAPVYYIDDITLIYKESINGFDLPVSFNPNDEVKYLITFDEIYEKNIPVIRHQDVNSAPTQSVVTASEVDVVPTTGNRMLQYKFPLMKASEGYKSAWHRWTIPEQMMKLFWKTYFYDGDRTNPYIIPRDEWKDWYFCYDVYNASPFAYNLSIKFACTDAKWSSGGASVEFTPGEWTTVKVSIDQICTDKKGLKDWTDSKGNVLTPDEYLTPDVRLSDPGYLWITHNAAPYTNGGVDENGETIKIDDPRITESYTRMVFYFDSFRVVHA